MMRLRRSIRRPKTSSRRGMRFVMFGRTTFVIAHRISTVKQADMVLVLEQGSHHADGNTQATDGRRGHYREIAVAQLPLAMTNRLRRWKRRRT